MRAMRAVLRVACVVVAASSGPAASEPGPIGTWLMNEPVSLWDKGMFAADRAARDAAQYVGAHRGQRAYGSAGYSWEDNEITLYFNVAGFNGAVTHEKCNELRRYFIGYVSYGAHSMSQGQQAREKIAATVSDWFSHAGYQSLGRDEKLGEKLSRIIFVRVNLWNKAESIMCRDQITVSDAPSRKPVFVPAER